jgi:translation initiation factor eIF-2B subunit beta
MAIPSDDNANLSSTSSVRSWLAAKHPKELAQLDKFETELRLGRLSTSSTASAKAVDANPNAAYEYESKNYGGISGRDRRLVTVRTVELLRSLIGTTKWKNAAQLMILLRGIGRELHDAGGFREPAIGNIVRRIMCAVRQEVANSEAEAEGQENSKGGGSSSINATGTSRDDENMHPIDEELAQSFNEKANINSNSNIGAAAPSTRSPSLVNLLWANPQHLTYTNKHKGQTSSRRKDSFSSVDSDPLDHMTSAENESYDFPKPFYEIRQHFRAVMMEVILEFMSDLKDLHTNIDDQATSHIHAGEVILTYGRSKTVESVRMFVCSLLPTFVHCFDIQCYIPFFLTIIKYTVSESSFQNKKVPGNCM